MKFLLAMIAICSVACVHGENPLGVSDDSFLKFKIILNNFEILIYVNKLNSSRTVI